MATVPTTTIENSGQQHRHHGDDRAGLGAHEVPQQPGKRDGPCAADEEGDEQLVERREEGEQGAGEDARPHERDRTDHSVRMRFAPRLIAAHSSRSSKFFSVAATIIVTYGMASTEWPNTMPNGEPSRCSGT